MKKKNNPIDIVITWVDGSDPKWLDEFHQYSPSSKGDKNQNRYRDYGILKYWFRTIEKNAPWVRYIHFVTWGHLPEWINLNHPKLKIVKHTDFVPQEYLPTFNCRVLEFNLHRINDLSENFIYFNDDMFLLNSKNAEDFFKGNNPIDTPIFDKLSYYDTYDLTLFRNSTLIQRNFDRKRMFISKISNWININLPIKNIIRNTWSIFSYGLLDIRMTHLPISFLKSDFEEIWDKENKCLNELCYHKFREYNSVNTFVIRMWNIHSNKFELPKSKSKNKWVNLNDSFEFNKKEIEKIFNDQYDLICLNDDITSIETFQKTKDIIIKNFEKQYPTKSSFER